MASRLEIEEEREGDQVETTDLFFEKIGEAVPVRSQKDSKFDTESPPSQPLAVSQRFQLLFLAHSSGFLVARTKDVIDLAKDIKEKGSSSSIEDLSLVDVPIGKLNILALSIADESTLAVSVAADIHFFNVDSLLNKDIKPFFSAQSSSSVKDFKWRKKDNSFLVLSDDRKLYHGTPTRPLKHVMDDVDAVEWSLKGAYVAVAKDYSLSILSSKFNEKLCISLSLPETGDFNDECSVKALCIVVASSSCFAHSQIWVYCSAEEHAVPLDVSALSDNEEDSSAVVNEEFNLPKLTYGQGEQKSEQVALALPLLDKSKMEQPTRGSSEIPFKSDANLSQRNANSVLHATDEAFLKDDDTKRSMSTENSPSFEAIDQQKPPTTKLYPEAGDQLKLLSGQHGANSGQSFFKTSQLEGPGIKVGDGNQTELQKIAGSGSIASFAGKFSNDASTQRKHDNLPTKFELLKESVGKTGSNGLQSASFQPWTNQSSQSFTSGKFMVSEESDARSPFSASTHNQYNRSQASVVTIGATNISSSNAGIPSHVKDTSGTSFSVNKFSGRPVDIGTRKSSIGAGNIESVPLIRGSQLPSQLNFALEKTPNPKLYPPKDDYKSSTQSVMLKSEPHLSKQFSNVLYMFC
ncbi:Nuclear pore complex protein [Corchorus olitorius]|uniref:Nuclear pore complex protein n=1 Tax=Corchorus olitorius TaxID=93759 RepID=A0A1R3GI91_9ROSI|nr:Nuclear pore complex protein [Corchorus olitorius]